MTIFQSTLLMRGATPFSVSLSLPVFRFQSTLLMRGATFPLVCLYSTLTISIHAPHARSDQAAQLRKVLQRISIHAPHARSDPTTKPDLDNVLFQSTLLMRGATWRRIFGSRLSRHFNPRSSCEERRSSPKMGRRSKQISIHAPHARSDCAGGPSRHKWCISIHAPHARSDRYRQD